MRSARSSRPSPRSSETAAPSARVELDRGVRDAPLVEVQSRPQGQLLADEVAVAHGEQLGETLLRTQGGVARAAPATQERSAPAVGGQLAGVAPVSVGHALALAEAGPEDERLGGGHLVDVGVGRGDAVCVQDPVEHRHGRLDLALGVDFRQPRLCLVLGRERDRVYDRGSRSRHRGGLRAGGHGPAPREPPARAPRRALPVAVGARPERAEHDDPLGLSIEL